MPRGVPKSGYRMTAKRVREGAVFAPGSRPEQHQPHHTAAKDIVITIDHDTPKEPDWKVEERLAERFEIMDSMVGAAIDGQARAVIISGPPGLGKSYGTEKKLEDWDPNQTSWTHTRGYVRTTALFKLLYQNREPGRVVVFDDADTIFFDETSLNFLKIACDTSKKRILTYGSEAILIDEESAQRIPRTFEFEGTIIFITNYDFDHMIARGHKLAPHLEALVSRAHYIDLSMKTKQDYMVRIKMVVKQGMLTQQVGLNPHEQAEVMGFIEKNIDRMRELSLRMALKVGTLRKVNPNNWEKVARITCLKNI